MPNSDFKRYFGEVELEQEGKRVDKLELTLLGNDFTGDIWFTDLMLQEGTMLTGHVPNTQEMHLRLRDREIIAPKVYFNAIIRSKQTLIVPNMGTITSAVDFTMTALERMPADTVEFQHGYGTRSFKIEDTLSKDDVYKMHASTRTASINDVPTTNYTGVFHQVPAGDAMFRLDVGKSNSVQLLVEFEEWVEGEGGKRL